MVVINCDDGLGLSSQQKLYEVRVKIVSYASDFMCVNKMGKSVLFPYAKIDGCLSSDNLMNELAMSHAKWELNTKRWGEFSSSTL